MQESPRAHRAMERLTLQFVFKGQMVAEGLWESESEPGHRYVKLLPGAAGAPGYNISRVQCCGRSGQLPLCCPSSGPGTHSSPPLDTKPLRRVPNSFPSRKPGCGRGGSSQSRLLLPTLCCATRASPGASLGILSMKEGENGLRCPEGRYQCTVLGPSVCEEQYSAL